VAGAALLACVTVLLTACTGSSGSSTAASRPSASASSAPASTAPASTAPASTAGTPASSVPATAPASPASGATSPPAAVAGAWSGTGAPCPDLQVKLGLAQATPNTTYQVIEFVNHGSGTCIMSGYPGVNLAGGTPVAPIGLPAAQGPASAAKVVILPPGGAANALLLITNAHTYSTATCGPVQARYLIVYRPHQAAPVEVAFGATACSQPVRMLQINAMSPGTGG
jgi:Domain of unknown function (DUF4232)